MNRLIIILSLILFMSCNSNQQQPIDTIASITPKDSKKPQNPGLKNESMYTTFTTEPYELKFDLQKLDNKVYEVILQMELKNGSYYVSPNSAGNFSGIFTVILEDNDKLEEIGELIETPLSVEEFDPHPFVNGNINWVRENTTYRQRLQLKSEQDFTIPGIIQFTIEPRCTLEKVRFFIKSNNGVVKIEVDRC